jgi:hypothetical protein
VLNAPPTPEQQAKKAAAKARRAERRRTASLPKIELLYFADCPNYQDALRVLREALAADGLTASVDLVLVETQAEAERQQFYGSPTIRVDGRDIVPPAPNARPALACRVYRTQAGAMTPIPPREAMHDALHNR